MKELFSVNTNDRPPKHSHNNHVTTRLRRSEIRALAERVQHHSILFIQLF